MTPASRTDGSIAEGRERHPDGDCGMSGVSLHAQQSARDFAVTEGSAPCRIKTPAGIKPGLPSVVLTLHPADKPDLLDLHTHRLASTVGISEEYVNSPHDGWRV